MIQERNSVRLAGLGEKEWQVMLADFRSVLNNNYSVPAKEQQELIAIAESTKKDIVVRK